jgi:hypothetical protein
MHEMPPWASYTSTIWSILEMDQLITADGAEAKLDREGS